MIKNKRVITSVQKQYKMKKQKIKNSGNFGAIALADLYEQSLSK